MITLLIGYLMALWIRRTERGQLVPVIVCAVAAELVSADYGAFGIMIIALFVMTRERTDRLPMQAMILAALCWFIGGMGWQIGPVYLPAQMFGVLAMIPIGLYNGRKSTASRAVQWGFYLFYPVHLTLLLLILWL